MNEMAFYLEYAVAEAGGLGSSDVGELNRDLCRRLHSRDGYATPLEIVARRSATAKQLTSDAVRSRAMPDNPLDGDQGASVRPSWSSSARSRP